MVAKRNVLAYAYKKKSESTVQGSNGKFSKIQFLRKILNLIFCLIPLLPEY